jgi:cytochrome c oxidase cbb3-type subunit III
MLAARSWKLALSASMLALGIAECNSLPGHPTPADYPLRPSAVTDYSELYHENCAGCHGVDGKFGAAFALNNPVYLSIVDENTLTNVVARGVDSTAMPPFAESAGGSLTDEQIAIIVGGMRKQWAREGVAEGAPPYAANSAGDPGKGAKVFETFCVSCHGADGKGGSAPGSIVDGSFLALTSDQDLRAIVIAGRPDLGHPDWKDYVAGQPMTAQQVSDVVAWLASKRPAMPRGASYAQGN